jgi:DNA-binding transcriptional MerR regulator
MQDAELLTATGAAHLVSSRTGRPCSPDTIRYHADRNRLPSLRIANGTRLFRPDDVQRLAETLAARDVAR